ncbi:hypothetical protein OVN18_01560 [Microcella daejeonensis]|uniref:Flagellar FliJ protein n=1 Tax=Microcella daejeonensis TaxID=2994971 RepID=A0A9E8MLM1_9MICO|nr:hypothetical protein [Microcella daejeonensis]WAB81734.1 hypothetical protein OVN18_01560 [Microcella daejeonensis]
MRGMFPLAGLLRVRTVEAETRAAAATAAARRLERTEARRGLVVAQLTESVSAPVDSASLAAVAAARASASSMMAGLDERLRADARASEQARLEERGARQRVRVVEKLAERHDLARTSERARGDQRDADELTGTHGAASRLAAETLAATNGDPR